MEADARNFNREPPHKLLKVNLCFGFPLIGDLEVFRGAFQFGIYKSPGFKSNSKSPIQTSTAPRCSFRKKLIALAVCRMPISGFHETSLGTVPKIGFAETEHFRIAVLTPTWPGDFSTFSQISTMRLENTRNTREPFDSLL